MDDVAERPASPGEARGLARRMLAEPADEIVGVGNGAAIRKVDMFLQVPPRDVLRAILGGVGCDFGQRMRSTARSPEIAPGEAWQAAAAAGMGRHGQDT